MQLQRAMAKSFISPYLRVDSGQESARKSKMGVRLLFTRSSDCFTKVPVLPAALPVSTFSDIISNSFPVIPPMIAPYNISAVLSGMAGARLRHQTVLDGFTFDKLTI